MYVLGINQDLRYGPVPPPLAALNQLAIPLDQLFRPARRIDRSPSRGELPVCDAVLLSWHRTLHLRADPSYIP